MSDLNRQIAELLGWSVTTATESNGYTCIVTHWNLFRPDGSKVVDTENDPVWYADTMGYATEAEAWQHVPDYEHNLDATMAEFVALKHGLRIEVSMYSDDMTVIVVGRFNDVLASVEWGNGVELPASAAQALWAYLAVLAQQDAAD